MHLDDNVWGWVCVLGSILCFGSFAVPVKSQRVKEANVDPVIFQTYKTFWALLVSLITFTYNEFNWTPWGIVSGLSWVPGGMAAILAVAQIGLGIAQGLWSGLIITVSFLWGSIVFQEKLKSWPLSILGVAMLLIGVVGMATSPLVPHKYRNSKNRSINSIDNNEDNCSRQDLEKTPLVLGNMTSQDPRSQQQRDDVTVTCFGRQVSRRKLIGYPAAIFAGVWGGSVMAPLKMAQKMGVKASGIEYVFSFGSGAAIVNIAILLLYSLFRVAVQGRSPPSFHFRVMFFPGMIAGVLWSIGNYLSIYAVLFLGSAIAYPSVQAALVVSGLWGIFYYKELKGLQVVTWFLSAFVVMGGLVLLSQMHA